MLVLVGGFILKVWVKKVVEVGVVVIDNFSVFCMDF